MKEWIVNTVQSAYEIFCLEFGVETVDVTVETTDFQPKRSKLPQ